MLAIRTVRHLRPVQVYSRLWHYIDVRRVPNGPAPSRREALRGWRQPALRRASMTAPDTFEFLGHSARVGDAGAWNDQRLPRLWRYNLHYFDDLVAIGASDRRQWHRSLVSRWIRENSPGTGAGWEPYAISLRVVNWIKWALEGGAGSDIDVVRSSLATQLRALRSRLEYHLLGNHLWANAKALVFGGAFFSGVEGDDWLRVGIRLIERELTEQVLPDGGHFERSPMYHAIVLEDVLDLVNLASAAPHVIPTAVAQQLSTTACRMLRWLRVMTHPDGRISFFNDAAFGIAADYEALATYRARLLIPEDTSALSPVEALPDSGYVRIQNHRAVAICDVGPVGPDYQPGHAHADTLSFELSLDGRRLVVNGGTSTYDEGPERARQRGTRAHSTVVIDGRDSSEVWAAFRVARRARPYAVEWGDADSYVWVSGAHDGYRRLAGRVAHHRRWELFNDHLLITDRLEGRASHAVAVFPLHPDVQVRLLEADGRKVELCVGGHRLATLHSDALTSDAIDSSWHPEFGSSVPSVTVTSTFAVGRLSTRISWA